MLEIEMKFPVPDFTDIAVHLETTKAAGGETLVEEDLYFRPPDRDFAQTDEAVRLRRTGAKNVATYKGPKEKGPTKTRKEVEVCLADGAATAEAFQHFMKGLRYRPVALVRKTRVPYFFKRDGFNMQACLDTVDGVGRFVELEILAEPERKQDAQETLQKVAAEMRLGNPEKRSYLEMVLSQGS